MAQTTGTKDKHYNLVSVLYHALQAADTCEIYIQDVAGDKELETFFRTAQDHNKQIAEQAKALLKNKLS